MSVFLWFLVIFGSVSLSFSKYVSIPLLRKSHANWPHDMKSKCGKIDSMDRIIGGKDAQLGQYPWMALLGYYKKTLNS